MKDRVKQLTAFIGCHNFRTSRLKTHDDILRAAKIMFELPSSIGSDLDAITDAVIAIGRKRRSAVVHRTLPKLEKAFPEEKAKSRKAERNTGLHLDCIYPQFSDVPLGTAPPVRYPAEDCRCGYTATRRAYYGYWKDRFGGKASDPVVALCEACALDLSEAV